MQVLLHEISDVKSPPPVPPGRAKIELGAEIFQFKGSVKKF
jgi:hypothetical protein